MLHNCTQVREEHESFSTRRSQSHPGYRQNLSHHQSRWAISVNTLPPLASERKRYLVRKQARVNVRKNATADDDGRHAQVVELLVVANGELDMARDDAHSVMSPKRSRYYLKRTSCYLERRFHQAQEALQPSTPARPPSTRARLKKQAGASAP